MSFETMLQPFSSAEGYVYLTIRMNNITIVNTMSSCSHFKLVFVVLMLIIVSCTGNEMIDPNKTVPDPEGTLTLDISNAKIDNKIYQKDGNLVGGLFLNLGEMNGLGNISSIPKDGWVSTVALMEGYGYIAWANNKYYRIYGHLLNERQTVIKYQCPFLGSESSIKVKNNNLSFSKEGGTETVTLDNKTLVPFSVSSPDKWISAKAVSSISNRPYDAIFVSVASNSSTENRKGSITVNSDLGEPITIQVEQGAGDAVLSVSPSSFSFEGIASSSSLSISSNTEYTVSSNQDWCTVNGKTLSVAENATGADRTATITVATSTGNVSKTLSVSQKKIDLSISQTSFQFEGSRSEGHFTVNADGISSWNVTSSNEWCTVSKTGNDVNIVVSQNNSASERSAQLTVSFPGTKGIVSIKQGIPTLSISQSNFVFDWRQNEGQFSVSSNVSDWSVSCDASWISYYKNGNLISFSVKENNTNNTRKTNVIISLPDGRNKAIYVVQDAMPSPFIDVSDQTVASDVSSYTFSVKSNIKWQVIVSSGITLQSSNVCDKDANVTIGLTPNQTAIAKTFTITFKPIDPSIKGVNKTIVVYQRKVAKWIKISIKELKDGDIFLFVYPTSKAGEVKVASSFSDWNNVSHNGFHFSQGKVSGDELIELPSYVFPLQVEINGDYYGLKAVSGQYAGKYLNLYGNRRIWFMNLPVLKWYLYPPSNTTILPPKESTTFAISGEIKYMLAMYDSHVYTAVSTGQPTSYCNIYRKTDNY